MGAKVSKTSGIDYGNIKAVMDINLDKLPRRCDHIIIYENGEQLEVSFTPDKEYKFRNRHRFAVLYRPINDIDFINLEQINNYKENNNDSSYSFTLVYRKESEKKTQDFNINKFQHYLFWKLLKVLNPIVFKENKSLRAKESEL
jgi:ABC-type multidrug transport system ATPase subunit